jgi:hypothetical protein
LGASWCLFVQVFGDLSVVSYWIDTLVLKKLRQILILLCCITLSSSREKPTQAQDVANAFKHPCCANKSFTLVSHNPRFSVPQTSSPQTWYPLMPWSFVWLTLQKII